MIINHIIITSGGQSGVDRAALDFALNHGIDCGGWCPRGRLAEDGTLPGHYPLQETSTADHTERTRLNIDSSDGTLIIYKKDMDEGTLYTSEWAQKQRKPVYIVGERIKYSREGFISWMKANNISKLNIAGPRESNEPGVYEFASNILETFLAQW